MSVFKRANWRSGLTYHQTCPTCKTTIVYTDHDLDYRPWYPNGFVYCAKCETPLRHNERYAVNQPTQDARSNSYNQSINYCAKCGKKVREGDVFCSGCGAKIE